MLAEDALDRLDREQESGLDLIFSVGTTSIFPYVTWPFVLAVRRDIPAVEINPERTPISDLVRYRLAAPAGVVLPEMLRLMAGAPRR